MTKKNKLAIIAATALLAVAGIIAIYITQLSKPTTPPIVPTDTQSSAPASSEPVEKPKPAEKPAPVVPAETPSSQPPTDGGARNPVEGAIKNETNELGQEVEKIFLDGKWWDNGIANDKTVDDSDKVMGNVKSVVSHKDIVSV